MRTTLISFILKKTILYFFYSKLSCHARYQKINLECPFGYKYLLNFHCQNMKFHNCHHASHQWRAHTQMSISSLLFPVTIFQWPEMNTWVIICIAGTFFSKKYWKTRRERPRPRKFRGIFFCLVTLLKV